LLLMKEVVNLSYQEKYFYLSQKENNIFYTKM
jgi:hypothetical protein